MTNQTQNSLAWPPGQAKLKTQNKLSTKLIYEQLKQVIDPELQINIVDLGLVYDVSVKDGLVKILLTLTTPGCPLSFVFEKLIKEVLASLVSPENVKVKLTFDPLWTPEKMSQEAKASFMIR